MEVLTSLEIENNRLKAKVNIIEKRESYLQHNHVQSDSKVCYKSTTSKLL